MKKTMQALCKDLSTCKYGYTQSDEITLVCICDDMIRTEGLYKYKVNKILSICASKTTKYFNKFFYQNVQKLKANPNAFKNVVDVKVYEKKLFDAEFDCRVMNIPDWDVVNNVIWRQQDATRNSIQMLGQSQFSQKELDKKSCSDIMDMLILQKNINWNDLETYKKRGCSCTREVDKKTGSSKWIINENMPILTEPTAKKGFNKTLYDKTSNNPLMKNIDE